MRQWRVPESTGFHWGQDIRPQRIWSCPQAFELLTKEYQIWWCIAYGALFPVAVKVALCDKTARLRGKNTGPDTLEIEQSYTLCEYMPL